MKRIFIYATVAAMAAAFTGCGDKCDSKSLIDLESYNYDMVGKFKDTLDFDLSVEGAKYIRLHGRGVLPVAGDSETIKALRDTLEKLGNVSFEKGEAALPVADDEVKLTDMKVADSKAASELFTDLNVALITPEVVVWRNFVSSYMAGAAHNIYQTRYLNYSVTEGKILKLSDLMKKDYRPVLLEKLRERLSERDDLTLALRDVDIPEVFYITDTGLSFVYGIYEVAPYSSGEVTVNFEAYELADILTPQALKMISGFEAVDNSVVLE